MALWANLHGGFFIGIATLALYSVVAALCDLAAGAGWRRGAELSWLTRRRRRGHADQSLRHRDVADGGARASQPIHAQRGQGLAAALVGDAGAVAFGALGRRALCCGDRDGAALVVALAAAPRADDLPLVAVAAMMTLAAFLSVRNMALAAMAMSGPLARHLAVLRARRADARRRCGAVASREPLRDARAAPCAMALGGGLFSRGLASDRAYPSAALAFMNAHGLHGNVLSEFGWGEYLIWHTAPEDKVFIDGRYDTVYPFKVIRDYLEFYFDQPGASAVLDVLSARLRADRTASAGAPPDGAAAGLEAALSRQRRAPLRTRERARGTTCRDCP